MAGCALPSSYLETQRLPAPRNGEKSNLMVVLGGESQVTQVVTTGARYT